MPTLQAALFKRRALETLTYFADIVQRDPRGK